MEPIESNDPAVDKRPLPGYTALLVLVIWYLAVLAMYKFVNWSRPYALSDALITKSRMTLVKTGMTKAEVIKAIAHAPTSDEMIEEKSEVYRQDCPPVREQNYGSFMPSQYYYRLNKLTWKNIDGSEGIIYLLCDKVINTDAGSIP